MKCYLTFTNTTMASSELDEDFMHKVSVYGTEESILCLVDSLGKQFVLRHVDMVEDKKKENNE